MWSEIGVRQNHDGDPSDKKTRQTKIPEKCAKKQNKTTHSPRPRPRRAPAPRSRSSCPRPCWRPTRTRSARPAARPASRRRCRQRAPPSTAGGALALVLLLPPSSARPATNARAGLGGRASAEAARGRARAAPLKRGLERSVAGESGVGVGCAGVSRFSAARAAQVIVCIMVVAGCKSAL